MRSCIFIRNLFDSCLVQMKMVTQNVRIGQFKKIYLLYNRTMKSMILTSKKSLSSDKESTSTIIKAILKASRDPSVYFKSSYKERVFS